MKTILKAGVAAAALAIALSVTTDTFADVGSSTSAIAPSTGVQLHPAASTAPDSSIRPLRSTTSPLPK